MACPKCEAPVFRPSKEQFENPFAYIESIRAAAEPFGICRIIPPPCWKPRFALDLNTFKFPTRIQSIHQLFKREPVDEARDSWWEAYVAFQLAANKKQRTRNPILGGKELELRKLYHVVEKHGGYHVVCRQKLWKEVANYLQVHLSNGNTTYSLRNVYEKYLKDFEENQGAEGKPSTAEVFTEAIIKKPKPEIKHEEPSQNRRRRSMRRAPSNLEALMCEHCGGGQFESCIILCDHCPTNRTKGYHTFCCSPPCDRIPDGNFYCPECSAALFGRECFTAGPDLTYPEFKDAAKECESNQLRETSTPEEIENDFWTIVEKGDRSMEVLYGADIPTGMYGSGFPVHLDDPYASHPMNLNNFPRAPDSLLSLITDDIPGVIVPWLYMGMKYSAFCWHVEDHLFYSINYLHQGAGKKWYGISPDQAEVFEELLKTKLLKDQLREQPDLLFHITTLVAPDRLREHGIRVCETLQQEGEFIITFPNAYHGGFNTGLNIAEAVNFAPLNWLRYRRRACLRYVNHRKQQVISVDELVLNAAMKEDGRFQGELLYEEVDSLSEEESLNRLTLWNQGVVKSMKISSSHGLKAGDTEDVCCVICLDYLHVSAVVCSCCHRPVCVRHVNQQCECPMSSRTLLYRFTLAELFDIRNQSCPSKLIEKIRSSRTKRDTRSHDRENPGMAKFHEFLSQWRSQAEMVLASDDVNSTEMETLLFEGMQFLWGGHEVDLQRELYARLKSSIEWYNGLERLGRSRDTKVTVEELKELIGKTPHTTSHPGVVRLKEMLKEVQDWILETEDVLHPVAEIELDALLKFYERGQSMNVLLPGLNLIKERVADARELQQRIMAVLEPQNSELYDIQHLQMLSRRAKDLKIGFAGRRQLDAFLENVDAWREKAKAVLGKPMKLQQLRGLLNEVGTVSANVSELLSLRNQWKEVEAWMAEANRALNEYNCIETMEALLERGRELNIEFPDMPIYEKKLAQLHWQQMVQQELQNGPLKLETVDDFLSKGMECNAQETSLFEDLKQKKETAVAWRAKAIELFRKIKQPLSEERVSFHDFQKLVDESSALALWFSEVQECKELFQTIQPLAVFIEQTMVGMMNGQSLKSWEVAPIVAKAESIAIKFDHLDELKRRIALAEAFADKAKNLLTTNLQLSHLTELKVFLKMSDAFVEQHEFKIAEMDILLEWDTRLRLEWLMHRLLCDPEEDSEVEKLGLPLDTVPFSPLEILKHCFSEAVQKQGTEPTPNRDERPQLDAVSAVLEQAKCVNANFQLIGRLERAYAGGLRWTECTQEAIHGSRKLKPFEIENLLKLGKENPFKLEGIDQLEGILTAYAHWTEDVNKTLSTLESTRMPLEDVQRLLTEIQRSAVIPEGEAAEKLKSIVQPASELRDSLQRELHGALEVLFKTVRKVASVLNYPDWTHSGFNGCYCGQVQGLDTLLTCSKCNHWYHAACIPTQTKSSRRWLCHGCKSSNHRIEQPSHRVLQEHLDAYRRLNVFLTEERILETILSQFHAWHAKVTEMLGVHENYQMDSKNGTKPLYLSELSCIWKQSMVIGIQCEELTERALRAVKVAECRDRIQEHLQDGGPTRFDIPRCRKEEIPLHIIDKKPPIEMVRTFVENSVTSDDPSKMDPLVHTAKAALATVYKWEAECQELISKLDHHSGNSIEHVPKELLRRTNEHINKATTICIQVNRDCLERLIFQSTPYCICRQTNDSDRPMLACEEEDDCPILWFHHRCVGLNENDLPPPGYRCPHCCLRKGEKYPYPLPPGSASELSRQYASQTVPAFAPVVANGPPAMSSAPLGSVPSVDIPSVFSEVASMWSQWNDIERLRVLERIGECVREESRRIHEQQQRNLHR